MIFEPIALEYYGLGILFLSFFVAVVVKMSTFISGLANHPHIKHVWVGIVSILLFYLVPIISSASFVHNTFQSGTAPLLWFFINVFVWALIIYLVLEFGYKMQLFSNISRKGALIVSFITTVVILSKYLSLMRSGNEFYAFISIIEFSYFQYLIVITISLVINLFLLIKVLKNDLKYIHKNILYIQFILMIAMLSIHAGWMYVDYF